MRLAKLAVLVAALPIVVKPAFADQIDGDWCHPGDGRHLEIQGPSITIPSGVQMKGNYDRHNFKYTDPETGMDILMRQLSDDLMILKPGDGEPEEWRRCDLQTS